MTKWSRGRLIAAVALLPAALLLGHQHVPNTIGNLGSLVETFLPWIGLSIPALLLAAAVRRSALAAVATALPAVIWLALFGHLVVPGKGGGESHLRVLTHNISDANPDPRQTITTLMATSPHFIALQELTPDVLNQARQVLRDQYPYHVSRGTVALWSRYRLAATGSVDIGLGWTRALRTEAETPHGRVAFYVAHLASVRIGTEGFTSSQRDRTISELADQISRERLTRVVVMGDFNGTAYDRGLAPLTFGLTSAQAEAGWGFGFSWPAALPMARIDHILLRGVTATKAWTLPRTGSDHRPVAADLRL